MINIKHTNINGVSYPIFKECLFQWFDKQENILSTSFFVEENFESNFDQVNRSKLSQNESKLEKENQSRENINFGPEYDVNLIILYRSLYILKRKFEMHEKEVLNIYSTFCEKNKQEFIIDVRSFSQVIEAILHKLNFSLTMINKGGDLFKAELMNQMDKEKIDKIISSLCAYMELNRRKYNTIMREKKEEKYLNSEEKEGINVDDDVYKNDQDVNADDKPNNINESEENTPKINIIQELNPNSTNTKSDILHIRYELKTFFLEKLKNPEFQDSNLYNNSKQYSEHQEKNLTRIEYLLIEVLPLIIADFVHENSNIAIIETEDELRHELRTLFDNEILQRLGESTKIDTDEEKTEKLKELLFEKLNTEKNIRFYEDLFLKKQASGENVIYISQMLQKLKNKKIWIENKIKSIQEDNNTFNNFNSVIKPNLDQTELKIMNKDFKDISSINQSSIRQLNVSKIIPKKLLTKEEKRGNSLKEIFYFYARQHIFLGLKPNFDEIKESQDHLNLSEFSKFCSEFKIAVKKEKLVEIFKKTATNSIQMKFDEYLNSLKSLSVKLIEEKKGMTMKKISKLKKDLQNLKTIQEEAKNKIMNKEGTQLETSKENEKKLNEGSNKNIIKQASKSNKVNKRIINTNLQNLQTSQQIKPHNESEIQWEISKLKIYLTELNEKTFEESLEELYQILEIDDEKAYRNKMKGFVLPFNSQEKNYRIPNVDIHHKAKKMDAETAGEVKRILKQRKEEKEKEQIEKERIEKLSLLDQKKKLFQMNEKTTKDKERFNGDSEIKYANIKQKYSSIEKEKDMKLTWDQLEKMNFDHFISKREDDFNPAGFLDGDEIDSDDEELLLNLNKIKEKNNLHNGYKNAENKQQQKESNERTDKSKSDYNSYSNSYINYNMDSLNSLSDKNMISLDYSQIKDKSTQYKKDKKVNDVKTEQKAKELEKDWMDKQTKLIQKYDDLVKRSQDKIHKSARKVKH